MLGGEESSAPGGQSVAGGAQSWGPRSPQVEPPGLAERLREWLGGGERWCLGAALGSGYQASQIAEQLGSPGPAQRGTSGGWRERAARAGGTPRTCGSLALSQGCWGARGGCGWAPRAEWPRRMAWLASLQGLDWRSEPVAGAVRRLAGRTAGGQRPRGRAMGADAPPVRVTPRLVHV